MKNMEAEVLRMKPGDVLVVRPKSLMPMEALLRLREELDAVVANTGVHIVVIDPGLEMVAVQAVDP